MEDVSELDQILKNTEFENTQQLKAIDNEREKIQAYQQRLKCNELESLKLKEQAVIEEEKAARFRKQHVINKDNIESLRHTSVLLAEHEEALKKKLQFLQEKVEQEKLEQASHVAKYEKVLAIYEAKYDTMEKVKLTKQRREELQAIDVKNALMESRIKELKMELKAICTKKKNTKSMIPLILQIATLRVETDRHLAKLEHELSASLRLKEKIKELYQDKAEKQMIASNEVDFNHDKIEGHSQFWYAKAASMPLSETTSMPLSCAEPGEEAAHRTTTNTKPAPAQKIGTSYPLSLQKEMSLRKPSTPCYDAVSSKAVSTPRFRLELPQFSTFSRKERKGSGNVSGTSSVLNSATSVLSTGRSESRPLQSSLQPTTLASFSGDASLKETHLVQAVIQPPKSPAISPLPSAAKEQPDFPFKVPTKAVRRITPTDILHKSGISPPVASHGSEIRNNFDIASQVNSTQSQAGVSTTHSTVSILQSVSASSFVATNKQPSSVSGSTILPVGGSESSSATYIPGFQHEMKQQQGGHQEMEYSQPPGSIQEQQYGGQESQGYDVQETHGDHGRHQELQPLPATTISGSHSDLGYEGQQEPVTNPESNQGMEFGQELAASHEQLYGDQFATGSQGFSQFGSDKSSFSFGGFGQDTGSNFGGGFGFFGGQQETSGTSSFGAGFSFGTSNSSEQNSGFSLNFGTSSDGQSSGSSFFNF